VKSHYVVPAARSSFFIGVSERHRLRSKSRSLIASRVPVALFFLEDKLFLRPNP